jgi:DNA-binding XRE family transcriptional regulator
MANPTKKTLREWRNLRGLTQQQLANEAGVSISTITNAESFRSIPNIRIAIKIAKVLSVDLGEIQWIINTDN